MRTSWSWAMALIVSVSACDRVQPSAPAAAPSSPTPARPPPVAPAARATPNLPNRDPAVGDTVPAAFRGEWNLDLAACGTGLNDSRLVIGEREIQFYESRGEVTATRAEGADQVAIEASMAGEGETWVDSRVFRLSRDGQTLTEVSDSHGLARRRCP